MMDRYWSAVQVLKKSPEATVEHTALFGLRTKRTKTSVMLRIIPLADMTHGGYGVTGVLATIYSLIGLILGILTLREKDIYRIFPVLGTILNVVALGGVSFLLYLGSRL